MRRRPHVKLYLRPSIAAAGSEVVAEAVLTSRSTTPVEAITMVLRGNERVGGGNQFTTVPIVSQRASFGPRTLEKGEHRVAARFPIPHHAPPSYRGHFIAIDYELELHVSIPWWLDRRERYVVPVSRRVPESEPEAPRVFANRGKNNEPYIEATLDDQTVQQASAISGATSFSNVSRARIKHINLEYQQREAVVHGNEVPMWQTVATYVSTILDRAPNEGETVRFRVGVPEGAAPTLVGAHARVSWTVAIVCVVSFGTDVRLTIPITVLPTARAPRRRRRELPPVGGERRALLLRAAAQRLELDADSDGQELRGTFGPATAVVRFESRDELGLLAVVDLAWPALDLALEVRERKWTDAFGEEVELDDAAFHKRFHLSARERERVERLFDDDVRRALLSLAEVAVDDEGAVLGAPISVQSLETVLEALTPMIENARVLASAVARVAPSVGYR